MDYIKLEWWNTCDIGGIYYQGGFVNTIYIPSDICKPSYNTLIEEEENGEGVPVMSYGRVQKIPEIQYYVPEYLADALSLLSVHNNVRFTYTNGLYAGLVRNCTINVEWDTDSNDCMALVTITFQQDDQVVVTNCCDNL